MTPEQASKLRKGDIVELKLRVMDASRAEEGRILLQALSDPDPHGWFARISDISEVLPRPLEAGDRVRVSWSINQDVGTVLAVDEVAAWVKWPNDERVSYLLSDLQRVEEDQ